MKKINSLLKDYAELKNEVVLQKLERTTHLKEHIKIAKKFLHQLRLYVRDYKFLSSKDEIHFFKNIKPHIHADFIFYNSQLKFETNKPNTTNSILKNYLKNELKKLESKKRKNLDFYRYYKHKNDFLDHIYFLRENKQLEIFDTELEIYLATDFYTSHDTLAAEVIAYDLLTNFYNIEVSNHYKTYSEIKNRSTDRIKFLKKLVEDFQSKLEYDDGI